MQRVLCAALAALMMPACNKATDPQGPPPVRIAPLSTVAATVAPGIHLLGELSPSAVYAVETSAGLVLIDAGPDEDGSSVRHQLQWLGLDKSRVRAILLTHVHGDHTAGAQSLRKATGAKVYIGAADAAILRAGGPREALFSMFDLSRDIKGVPTTADVELQGDEVITVGDVRFQALSAPGHTPGSTCYLMQRGNLRVLFSGDVIWSLEPGFDPDNTLLRPLGTYAAYLSPRYRGDAKSYLATLRRLRALPAPDMVLPGHPRNEHLPASPLMTQPHWEALLDPGIREMERLLVRYQQDGASFLDGVARRILPDLYYLGDFNGVAVYGLLAAGKFFLVNAPDGAGLGDFLAQRWAGLGLKPGAPTAVILLSGEPRETGGLPDLCRHARLQVVAPRDAWDRIRHLCPTGTRLLSPNDLGGQGWFAASPIPLGKREGGPVSYQLTWAQKTVLLSGAIPVKPSDKTTKALRDDFSQGRSGRADYMDALQRMRTLRPDLWLPAYPVEGQNANLYGNEWQAMLQANRRVAGEARR